MAQGYSYELEGVSDGTLIPPKLLDGRLHGGRVRAYLATFDLSRTANKKVSGDTNVCFTIKKGEKPLALGTSGSVTMGATATIAIGPSGASGKYRAAAVHTSTAGLVWSMLSTALDDDPLTADEEVLMTIAAADLPASGIFQVLILTSGR